MTSAGETFPSYIPELLFKVYIKTFFLEKSGEGLNPLVYIALYVPTGVRKWWEIQNLRIVTRARSEGKFLKLTQQNVNYLRWKYILLRETASNSWCVSSYTGKEGKWNLLRCTEAA